MDFTLNDIHLLCNRLGSPRNFVILQILSDVDRLDNIHLVESLYYRFFGAIWQLLCDSFITQSEKDLYLKLFKQYVIYRIDFLESKITN